MEERSSGFFSRLKSSKKSFKTVVRVLICIVFLIVGIAAGLCLYPWFNNETEEVDSIREEIVPVAELATYEYNFTEILVNPDINTDDNNPLNYLLGKKYIATIEGKASIGVDAEKIEVDAKRGIEGSLVEVDVKIPHSKVFEPVTIDHGSLKKYESKDGLFNPVTVDDYNSLLIETNEKQVEKVKNSKLLDQSDARVKELITNQLKSIYGDDLKVNFTFIEEEEGEENNGD